MTKNACISMLICLNLALLAGIVLCTYSPPAAQAQATGLAGNYVMVAGEIRDQFDALYVIDMRVRVLHAFMYDRGQKRMFLADSRDLERDMRSNRGG
ncbi:MAG: hypothetical protein LC135_16715 [Phycisphaerae bacterium]|nr:hypothetical protein [Phycisphaerae bacterium]MCZ2401483.1 hypothetical protein [Phycisphaerae bacterium]NUQ48661.1 hypothetical protein [Phycisphaerae bacterium]